MDRENARLARASHASAKLSIFASRHKFQAKYFQRKYICAAPSAQSLRFDITTLIRAYCLHHDFN